MTMRRNTNMNTQSSMTLVIGNRHRSQHATMREAVETYSRLRAESDLSILRLRKIDRRGASAYWQSGGRVSSAYKYPRTATSITIERGSQHWYLTGAARVSAWGSNAESPTIMLTEAQDAAAVAAFRAANYITSETTMEQSR